MMKHKSPNDEEPKPAYMFKLFLSMGLILLGGLFAGE